MNARPNIYAGKCHKCHAWIPAQEGLLGPKVDGRWTVLHDGPCPVTAAATPTTPAVVSTVKHPPTAEQAEALRLFATGKPLAIEAGAGTGKTSTLVMLADWAAEQGLTGQYLAFNKAIVVEAGRKFNKRTATNTAHSLAHASTPAEFRARLNSGGRVKPQDLARMLDLHALQVTVGSDVKHLAGGYLAGLVMRAVTNFCNSADPTPTDKHIPYIDGIDTPAADGKRGYANNNRVRAYVLPALHAAWSDLCDPEGRLPYSHACYLKQYQLSDPRIDADYILFDEAQDANPVMLAIVEAQAKFGTQLVFVGDSNQRIYEFTGAINAMADIKAMGSNVCYLTQSFRFGQAVADVANGLLVRLDSELHLTGFAPITSTVGPVEEPDCILSRTNAEAVRQLLQAVDAGRRPYLVGGGKEIAAFARAAKALMNGQRTGHHDLACFESWDEVVEYTESDEQGGDLKLMVKLISDFGVDTILDAVNASVREEDADVVISTAHKAKGREWASVLLTGDFFKPKKGEGELPPAELRLLYVAVTRAAHNLDVTMTPQALRAGATDSYDERD